MGFSILMIATGVWALCGIAWLLFGERRFSSPLFLYLIFHFVAFIVRPWSLHFDYSTRFLADFVGIRPSTSDLERALWQSIVALLAFTIAGITGEAVSRGQSLRMKPIELDPRAVGLVGVAIIGVGLMSYAAYGVTPWAGDQRTYVSVNTGAGYKEVSSQTAYVSSFYILIAGVLVVWISKFGLRSKFMPILAMYMAIVLYSGFARTNYVLAAFAIAMALMHRQGRSWPPRKYAIVFLFVALSFTSGKGWFQALIDEGSQASVSLASDRASSATDFDGGELFINFDTLAGVNYFVPRFVDYAGPSILTRVTYFWVPRTVWPSKPLYDHAAGYVYANIQSRGSWHGLTVTLVGESYVALGQAGVAILMGIYGFLYGYVNQRLFRYPPGSVQAVLGISISASSIQVFRDGIISAPQYLLYYAGPCLLMLVATRVFYPESQAGGSRAEPQLAPLAARPDNPAPKGINAARARVEQTGA